MTSKELAKKWDVFICHATEDKEEVAEPLTTELREVHKLQVWYDRFEIRIGDSLIDKINEGLAKSRFGVVVFSKKFFEKKWPAKELKGLHNRAIQSDKKVILPIRHKISVEEVAEQYPLLGDLHMPDTSKGIKSLAKEIADEVKNERQPEASSSIKAASTAANPEVTRLARNLLTLLSEVQIALSDVRDHHVNPQLERLRYDVGRRGEAIISLTARPLLKTLKIDIAVLKQIGKRLKDIQNFQLYMGAQYWNEFVSKADSTLAMVNPLVEQLHTDIPRSEDSKSQYRDILETTIEELRNAWEMGQGYQIAPELETLRDHFRVFGNRFQALANMPESDSEPNLRTSLLEIARRLRTLSSVSGWGLGGIGFDHIEHIRSEVEASLQLADKALKNLS